MNCKDTDTRAVYLNNLNKLYNNSLDDLNTISIIFNVSIKNNTTLIVHIYRRHFIVTKIVYFVMNILSTKAVLFAIKYDINQVVQIQDINYILVIINIISTSQCIFDLFNTISF